MYKLPIDNKDGHKTNMYMDRWATEATIVSSMDLEPYLKQNKQERKDDIGSIKMFRDGALGKKVASIPNIVVDQLMKDGIWNDSKRFWKWLDQADQQVFRTNTGSLL